MDNLQTLPLSKLALRPETQSRAAIDQDTVQNYCDSMLDGEEFPPIIVFFDGLEYYVVDGYHRCYASKKAGIKDVAAKVMSGSLRDAILYSTGVNPDHGLPRNRDDKRKIVMKFLDDFEWSEWTDAAIARKCHISAMTIGRIRKSLNLEQDERKYINKNGKETTIKTESIGKRPELVPPLPEPEVEDEHLQELAHANVELAEEVTALKDRLAVKALDATEEEKTQYIETVAELRATIKAQEAEISALKSSRDQLLAKNSDMLKQISYWKKKAEKAA